MKLTKVTKKSIGLFLGRIKKMTSKETNWTKTETPRGRTVYDINVPSLDNRFQLTVEDNYSLAQIPTECYLKSKRNAKRLEAIFISLETGNKEIRARYE